MPLCHVTSYILRGYTPVIALDTMVVLSTNFRHQSKVLPGAVPGLVQHTLCRHDCFSQQGEDGLFSLSILI